MWAGLRIVDIRNPASPRRLPTSSRDGCSGHVRYLLKPDIWLSCGASGFYVLELKPEVRAALGFHRQGSSAS